MADANATPNPLPPLPAFDPVPVTDFPLPRPSMTRTLPDQFPGPKVSLEPSPPLPPQPPIPPSFPKRTVDPVPSLPPPKPPTVAIEPEKKPTPPPAPKLPAPAPVSAAKPPAPPTPAAPAPKAAPTKEPGDSGIVDLVAPPTRRFSTWKAVAAGIALVGGGVGVNVAFPPADEPAPQAEVKPEPKALAASTPARQPEPIPDRPPLPEAEPAKIPTLEAVPVPVPPVPDLPAAVTRVSVPEVPIPGEPAKLPASVPGAVIPAAAAEPVAVPSIPVAPPPAIPSVPPALPTPPPALPTVPAATPSTPEIKLPDLNPTAPAAPPAIPSVPPAVPDLKPAAPSPLPIAVPTLPDTKPLIPVADVKPVVPEATKPAIPKPPKIPDLTKPVLPEPTKPIVPEPSKPLIPEPAKIPELTKPVVPEPTKLPEPPKTVVPESPFKPVGSGPKPEVPKPEVPAFETPKPKPAAIAPVSAVGDPPRTDFDVEVYDPRAGENYESISKHFYGDAKYAEALKAFNAGRPIGSGGSLQVPPMYVLRKQHSNRIGAPRPEAERPAPAKAPEVEWSPSRTSGYAVPRGGMTMWDVAEDVYGDRRQWKKIWDANPRLDPNAGLPVGSSLQLPSDARARR